jgi:hypothetical protein
MRYIKGILTALLLPLSISGFHLQRDVTLRNLYHNKAQFSMQIRATARAENRNMIEERTAFLRSWRFFIGAQAILSGSLGTIAPSVLLRLAHVHLEPDGAMMLFSCLCATTIIFGHSIMNSEEQLALIAGSLYFSGWAAILLAAFKQQVVSGSFSQVIVIWQVAMAAIFITRTVMHRKASRKIIPETLQRAFGAKEKVIRNLLCSQLFIFGVTGILFPTFFFQQVFFMLNEPTSPPMTLFARGIALTSALMGGLLIQIKKSTLTTGIAAAYFGSLSLISFFTCGNPLSPLFAPINSILAIFSFKRLRIPCDIPEEGTKADPSSQSSEL